MGERGDGDITEVNARAGSILGRTRGPALPLESSRRAGADDSGLWDLLPARREIVHIEVRTRGLTRLPVRGDLGPARDHRLPALRGTLHDIGTLTRGTVLERPR